MLHTLVACSGATCHLTTIVGVICLVRRALLSNVAALPLLVSHGLLTLDFTIHSRPQVQRATQHDGRVRRTLYLTDTSQPVKHTRKRPQVQ